MPPVLKPSRAYHEALRRIGIQTPGELGIQTPVQLTVAVDDFSHLAFPLSVGIAVGWTQTPGTITTHAGFELVAGARTRGIFVDWIDEQSFNAAKLFVQTAPADFVAGVLTPRCVSGPPIESTFNQARMTSPLPNPSENFQTRANQIYDLGLYLAPGERLIMVHINTNSTGTYAVRWREYPTTGPVEP